MAITSIKLWVIFLSSVFNLSGARGDCCYVVVPKLIEAFNFYVAVQARHSDISTRDNTYRSEISFPTDYQVREFPNFCTRGNNATNVFTCTQREDLFSARFLLFTPENSNKEPLLSINIYSEICGKRDYCPKPTPVDKGAMSLGPFGVYPRPLAIASICIFGTAILCGIYLVYRSNRVRLLANRSTNPGCIGNQTRSRKVLNWPFFMCGCCTSIPICSRKTKHSHKGLPTNMIEVYNPNTNEVPGRNPTVGNPIRSLRSISVHELGSGLKDGLGSTLPRCSLILDSAPNGEVPVSNEDSSQNKSDKQARNSKLVAKADLYRTQSAVIAHADSVKRPDHPDGVHISRTDSTKNKSKEPLININEWSNTKVNDSTPTSVSRDISRSSTINRGLSRHSSTYRAKKEDVRRTQSFRRDSTTKHASSRRTPSVGNEKPNEMQRTSSTRHLKDKPIDKIQPSRSSSLRTVSDIQKPQQIYREQNRTSQASGTLSRKVSLRNQESHNDLQRGRSMKRRPSARISYRYSRDFTLTYTISDTNSGQGFNTNEAYSQLRRSNTSRSIQVEGRNSLLENNEAVLQVSARRSTLKDNIEYGKALGIILQDETPKASTSRE
ncbi:hypothetical protein K7432_010862 [Basidiobolus ranarum]|uniref:Uncharacterized protein n=1 Tax=Basidiobolus ranarum TaxID=34480 RepID=A0ABR2WN68_9FUNG